MRESGRGGGQDQEQYSQGCRREQAHVNMDVVAVAVDVGITSGRSSLCPNAQQWQCSLLQLLEAHALSLRYPLSIRYPLSVRSSRREDDAMQETLLYRGM